MSYQVPVAEYDFLLRQVIGAQETLSRATEGAVSVDDAVDVIAGAGQFATEVLHPINPIGDRTPPC